MARFPSSSPLLIALSLIATKLALTNAQLGFINGNPIARVSVSGLLTCSIPSPSVVAPPLGGVNVTLYCDNGITNLGQALTNLAGFYEIILSVTDDVIFHPSSNCTVRAKLGPTANCTVFPPQGVLQSPLAVVSIVGSALGLVISLVSTGFTLV